MQNGAKDKERETPLWQIVKTHLVHLLLDRKPFLNQSWNTIKLNRRISQMNTRQKEISSIQIFCKRLDLLKGHLFGVLIKVDCFH